MLRRFLSSRFRTVARATALIATLTATATLPNPAAGQGSPPTTQAPAPQQAAPPAAPAKGQPAPANGTSPAAKPAAPKPVSEALQTLRDRLDTIKTDLESREKAITGQNVGAGDLTRARDGLDGLADRLRAIIDLLGPRLEAARERLEQIGPKPKEGAEGEEVARERAEREQAVNDLDGTQRLSK